MQVDYKPCFLQCVSKTFEILKLKAVEQFFPVMLFIML